MNATLIELPAFTRYRADYLDDEHFRGLRKLRHGHPRRGGAMIKRNLFSKINEGFDALAGARAGKQTLRTHEVETNPAPEVNAAELKALRERLNLSRPVFAHYLRTNPRTLENWGQGRSKPNAQAALLIRLVEKFPDTMKRLAQV